MILKLFWCDRCGNVKAMTTEQLDYLKQRTTGRIICGLHNSHCGGELKEVVVGFLNELVVKE